MAKAKRAKDRPVEIEASGNVFGGLGLPDAGERLAKAELAPAIRKIVKDKNWTRRRAADVLEIAPPDVSDLMRGKLARFSQERLERFLSSLNTGRRTVADLVSETRLIVCLGRRKKACVQICYALIERIGGAGGCEWQKD